MIAVALGLLSLVVMIATGVAASSTADDHLTFLGVGVQTTTAQVFLTGAIFGWVFVIALWLLRVGIHRSGERCAQLADRRRRRASEWLGFGKSSAEGDEWGRWDEWGDVGRRLVDRRAGTESAGLSGIASHTVGIERSRSAKPDATRGVVRRTGTTRHSRGAPWRPDGGADHADRAVASAADQAGPLRQGHTTGPVAGDVPGLGVDGGTQRREIGRGSGAMPGEDRGSEGERRAGEGRQ